MVSKQVTWRKFGCVLLATGMSVYIIASCVQATRHFQDSLATKTSRPSLAEIEQRLSIRFPKSTRLKGSYEVKAWDNSGGLYASVEIDRAEVMRFIKSLPRGTRESISKTDRRLITNSQWTWPAECAKLPKPAWWNPDSVRRFISFGPLGRFSANMLVSLDDPRHARVYLFK